jgi:hypothetical protein
MDPPWINGEHSLSPSDLSFYNLSMNAKDRILFNACNVIIMFNRPNVNFAWAQAQAWARAGAWAWARR